jgi:hypothetical protein
MTYINCTQLNKTQLTNVHVGSSFRNRAMDLSVLLGNATSVCMVPCNRVVYQLSNFKDRSSEPFSLYHAPESLIELVFSITIASLHLECLAPPL